MVLLVQVQVLSNQVLYPKLSTQTGPSEYCSIWRMYGGRRTEWAGEGGEDGSGEEGSVDEGSGEEGTGERGRRAMTWAGGQQALQFLRVQ